MGHFPPFNPTPINPNYNHDFSNIRKDVIIYNVTMETENEGVKTKIIIFETNDKLLAEIFLKNYKETHYLEKAAFELETKYVEHSTIEDGYYTYSHIYDTGEHINFNIYNLPTSYNIADIVSEWYSYVVKYDSSTTHWSYTHVAYSNDKKELYFTLDVENPPLYYGIYIDSEKENSKIPSQYRWFYVITGEPIPLASHSEFSYNVNVYDTLVKVQGQLNINKRNLRYDNWKNQKNKDYPFIGGYET